MVLQLQTQNCCFLQWLCTIGHVFTSYMANTRRLQGCRAAAGPPPGFLHSSCRYPTEHRLSSRRVPRDLLHGPYRPPADLLQGSYKAPTRLLQGSLRARGGPHTGLLRGSCGAPAELLLGSLLHGPIQSPHKADARPPQSSWRALARPHKEPLHALTQRPPPHTRHPRITYRAHTRLLQGSCSAATGVLPSTYRAYTR